MCVYLYYVRWNGATARTVGVLTHAQTARTCTCTRSECAHTRTQSTSAVKKLKLVQAEPPRASHKPLVAEHAIVCASDTAEPAHNLGLPLPRCRVVKRHPLKRGSHRGPLDPEASPTTCFVSRCSSSIVSGVMPSVSVIVEGPSASV